MALFKKKKAPKKSVPDKATISKKNKKNTVKDFLGSNEGFIPLFTLVGGLLLAVFIYFPEGFFGSVVCDFFTGLFGWPAYLLPLLLIVNGIHKCAKNYEQYKTKYIYVTSGIAFLSIFTNLFMPKLNPLSFSSLGAYCSMGAEGSGGGLFGGFIADVLRSIIGSAATFIIAFTAIIVITMTLFNWSPVKLLLRGIVKLYMKATGKRFKIPPADKRKEKPAQLAVGDNGEVEFVNFSDDDLGIDEKKKGKKSKDEDKEDLPWEEDEDIMSGFDEMLDKAIPATPSNTDDSKKSNVKSSYEAVTGEPEYDDDDFYEIKAEADEAEFGDHKYVDAPEKLTGMEDVTDEMETAFERIPYTFPPVSLLNDPKGGDNTEDLRYELRETAQKLIAILKSFNIDAKPMGCSKGPTVTRYEIMLGEGVKVSKLSGLVDDIALRLAVPSVRIEPVPGKEAIGIEIPNQQVNIVNIKEVIASNEFRDAKSNLSFAMGKDISGKNIVYDIAKMPHVLIAGSTGSGKSVCINALIASLIYKSDPNDVKLLMIDPKVVELGVYNGIPHLLIPVVTEPRRASGALYWAVQEMLRRYQMFAENNVRDIKGYNEMIKEAGGEETMPQIVIIIDELADLMMVAPNEVEESICRLAQMARAAGMHLVIATQRPSVDVITGLIKANIPSRIAFAVSSHIDSRTILDSSGADKLLGRGDMLFKPVGANKPLRIQCAYIDDKEVERMVEFIKDGSTARYNEDIIEKIDAGKPVNVSDEFSDPNDADELLAKAIEIAVDTGKISASHLQRRLKVGFSRAARIIDQMEERGIVSPPDGSKPREVLITKDEFLEMSLQ
ncbi:MAG: DNA translocase FtsK [Clostridia bacterium]|nr:DNA translocase FtsK [Clostridia bacterium]